MEELFELIYFFIPLAFILFFRFFSNRSARNDQSNKNPDSPTSNSSSGRSSGRPANFLSELGQQVRDFLGLPSDTPTQAQNLTNQRTSNAASPQKKYQSNNRTAASIAQSMYQTDLPSGSGNDKKKSSSNQPMVKNQSPKNSQRALTRINRLPRLQQAIIWNELLNKPKGW